MAYDESMPERVRQRDFHLLDGGARAKKRSTLVTATEQIRVRLTNQSCSMATLKSKSIDSL